MSVMVNPVRSNSFRTASAAWTLSATSRVAMPSAACVWPPPPRRDARIQLPHGTQGIKRKAAHSQVFLNPFHEPPLEI
jgi:hypothetical protein